ncbi:MAG: glycosyltransferase family 2 protein [Actinomycetes bacterium]
MTRIPLDVSLFCAIGAVMAIGIFLHLLLNCLLRRRVVAGARAIDERIAVLIPMRNEEAHAAAVLADVLAQEGAANMNVWVCDDHSGDNTWAIISAVAAADNRVRVFQAADLPLGWLGKPWACQQLRQAVRDADAERDDSATCATDVLIFIDADVRLAPNAVSAAVSTMKRHQLAFLSPFPKQIYRGWLPTMFQPLLQWAILSMLPLRLMERSARTAYDRELAAGNGQFLAIDAVAYDAARGHESVRSEVVEDVMLARSIKLAGGRVSITPAPQIATCEMYPDAPSLIEGYTKSLWRAFGGRFGAVAVAALFLMQFIMPWVGMFTAPPSSLLWWLCIGGVLAGLFGRVVAALVCHERPWLAITHPLSILVFVWLVAESLRRKANGQLQWKGRALV